MCGRYYVDDDTAKEIEKYVQKADRKLCCSNTSHIYSRVSYFLFPEGASCRTFYVSAVERFFESHILLHLASYRFRQK